MYICTSSQIYTRLPVVCPIMCPLRGRAPARTPPSDLSKIEHGSHNEQQPMDISLLCFTLPPYALLYHALPTIFHPIFQDARWASRPVEPTTHCSRRLNRHHSKIQSTPGERSSQRNGARRSSHCAGACGWPPLQEDTAPSGVTTLHTSRHWCPQKQR